MQTLFEKYQPRTFDDVVGQDATLDRVRLLLSHCWGGRAWWISGASCSGKTTIARIIAGRGADDLYVTEYDSAEMITVTEVKRIERNMFHLASGRGGRAFTVNEAHGLRRAIIGRPPGLLERIRSHSQSVCRWFRMTLRIGS